MWRAAASHPRRCPDRIELARYESRATPATRSRMHHAWPKTIFLSLVIFWCALFLSVKINLATADLGRHIMNGQILLHAPMAEKLALLHTNFFSYTMPEQSFVNHHWASGVIFYIAQKLSGFVGLSALYTILSLIAILLFWNVARKLSNFYVAAILVLILAPLLAYRAEVRPEVWTYLFSGIFLNLLFFRRYLWLLPLLMLMWVNLHIGFIFGFLTLGAFWLEELVNQFRGFTNDFRKLTVILITTGITALINPFGYKILLYPFRIFEDYGYRIVENQSIRFLEHINFSGGMHFLLVKFVMLAVLLSTVILLFKRLKVSLSLLIITLALMVVSYLGIRHIALFSLFAMVLLARPYYLLFSRRPISPMVITSVVLVIISMAIGGQQLVKNKGIFGWGLAPQVNAAAEFFEKNHLSGPIFNNYDTGGYLIYHLFPKERVYVDNRPEAYTKEFFQKDYILPQENETRWLEIEKQYGFNTIFFSYRDYTPWAQSFIARRLDDKGWAPVFADHQNIIFLKENGINKKVIEKFKLPRELFQTSQ